MQAAELIPNMTFTEGLRWHEGRLWFSDLYTGRVLSAREDGSDVREEAVVPNLPSGLGWLPDGRLLVVSMMDRQLMRREHDGELVVHADLVPWTAGPLGDLLVDAHGRAFLGDFGFDLYGGAPMAPTGLLRVDPDGSVARVATDLWFPNGCALTKDGVLLVDETFGNRVTAFDVTDGGELTNRRVWAEFGPLPTATLADDALAQVAVAPDGCCLDADGGLWIADIARHRMLRVVEGGTITHELDLGTCVFACAVGGTDGSTLFVCATPDFDVETRKRERDSSIVAVDLKGLGPTQALR